MTAARIFLSNPKPLAPQAKRLADALKADGLKVKGAVTLLPGDPWDEVHYDQRASRVTAALVAPDDARDWYQNEDIVRGIALAEEARHKVVPVYLSAEAPDDVPYGLQRLTPLFWAPGAGPAEVVRALREVAEAMAEAPKPKPAPAASTVFLLYAAPDLDWAMWMAGQLKGAGFSPRYAEADLTAGQNRWLYASGQLQADRVLLLVSKHMPGDDEIAALWTAAFDGDPAGHRAQLVPVLMDDTPPPRLLGPRKAIDLRSHLDDAAAASAALVGALKPRKRKGPAPFPGGG